MSAPPPIQDRPDEETIIAWLSDEEEPEALDGCPTDPDGICEHGQPSWLRHLGLV